jgi:hypothetical protein
MKSHKIQRLELISDKIKAGDSKREVMCIHFDHHQRKTTLVGVLHGRAVMARLELHGRHAGSPERKGRGRRGVGEGAAGCMEREKWAPWGKLHMEGVRSCCLLHARVVLLLVHAVCRKKEGEENRKEKEEKEKNKI